MRFHARRNRSPVRGSAMCPALGARKTVRPFRLSHQQRSISRYAFTLSHGFGCWLLADSVCGRCRGRAYVFRVKAGYSAVKLNAFDGSYFAADLRPPFFGVSCGFSGVFAASGALAGVSPSFTSGAGSAAFCAEIRPFATRKSAGSFSPQMSQKMTQFTDLILSCLHAMCSTPFFASKKRLAPLLFVSYCRSLKKSTQCGFSLSNTILCSAVSLCG